MVTIQSILLNAFVLFLPIIIIAIPLIFLRKGTSGKIYKRFFYGITIFFLVYFIMPSIFQIGDNIGTIYNNEGTNFASGINYMLLRTIALIFNYFQYPLYILPFIFMIAPFISIIFLWNQLRGEDGKFRRNLSDLTIEIKKSPKELIKDNLNRDWSDEKQLFKLMTILLPISLYLLTTILKITGLIQPGETLTVSTSSSLGWFLEIFFVYLATFLFSINLLKVSNVSFKGKFLGEKLVNDTSSSLITVGTPISLLSILLFIVEFQESILLIFYFFAYFLMATFIFITYLAIFQPLCTIFLVKIIEALKRDEKREEEHIQFETKSDQTGLDYLLGILFTFLSIIVVWLMTSFALGYINYFSITYSGLYNPQIYPAGLTSFYQNIIIGEVLFDTFIASFPYHSLFEVISIWSSIIYVIITVIISLLMMYAFKNTERIGIISFLFIVLFIIIGLAVPYFGISSTFFGFEETYWFTGKLVRTNIFNSANDIIIIRTALIPVNFENPILFFLAVPYNVTRYPVSFLLWSLWFFYIQKNFITKSIKHDKLVDLVTFSITDQMPSGNSFKSKDYYILSNQNESIPDSEREEIMEYYNDFKNGKMLEEIRTDDKEKMNRLYTTLRYMTINKWLTWWKPEFTFTFERAELDGLYIMYSDGRDVISYQFNETTQTDPALVAGMFSAITSFISETTKSKDFLRTIDHGDRKITIEYGKYVFGAIFANMETSEIRSKLKDFLKEFERRHRTVLEKWNGNTTPFRESDKLIEEVFEVEQE